MSEKMAQKIVCSNCGYDGFVRELTYLLYEKPKRWGGRGYPKERYVCGSCRNPYNHDHESYGEVKE